MSINIENKCENCFHKGICNHQKTYTNYITQAADIAPMEYDKSTTVYSSNIETARETNLNIRCRDFIDIRVRLDILVELRYLKELLDSDSLELATTRLNDMVDLIENDAAVVINYEE